MTLVRSAAIVGFCLAIALPGGVASAQGDLDKRDADWWQWALAAPSPDSPLLDPTGAHCAVGQHGRFWYLAGGFGGGTVTRSCTVPKNKTIFFPVANQINFNTPNVCGQGPDDLTVASMRAASAAFADGVTNVQVEVDGQAVGNVERLRSRVFSVTLAEDNVFDPICVGAGLGDVPGDKYEPAVDEGFYVELDDLCPGAHTVHFHAENAAQGFSQDVTYYLTVQGGG